MDVKQKKRYILQHFRYREYAENFSRKMKQAVKKLDILPAGHEDTGFRYRGYSIYLLPVSDHLLFYTVDDLTYTVTVLRVLQEGMDWQYIIQQWIKENL